MGNRHGNMQLAVEDDSRTVSSEPGIFAGNFPRDSEPMFESYWSTRNLIRVGNTIIHHYVSDSILPYAVRTANELTFNRYLPLGRATEVQISNYANAVPIPSWLLRVMRGSPLPSTQSSLTSTADTSTASSMPSLI